MSSWGGSEWGALIAAVAAASSAALNVWQLRQNEKLNNSLIQATRDTAAKDRVPRFAIKGAEYQRNRGWSDDDLLRRLIGLDYTCVNGLVEGHEGTVQQWAPVFARSTKTWRLLVYGGDFLVGYWSAFALKAEAFERAKAGGLLESELTTDIVVPMDEPGEYRLLFSMLCVHPDYRHLNGAEGGDLLMRSILGTLRGLDENGYVVAELLAHAYTPEGLKAARDTFKLTEIQAQSPQGPVYWADRVRVRAILRRGLSD